MVIFVLPDEDETTFSSEEGAILPVGCEVSVQPQAPSYEGAADYRVSRVSVEVRVYGERVKQLTYLYLEPA